jgi:hypothetical protein
MHIFALIYYSKDKLQLGVNIIDEIMSTNK